MSSSMETNLVSLNPFIAIPLHRRDFLRMAAKSAIGVAAASTLCAFGRKNTGISGEQPNIVMFVMDDLNDWVTPLGYYQAKTPNHDRLAKSGVTFKIYPNPTDGKIVVSTPE